MKMLCRLWLLWLTVLSTPEAFCQDDGYDPAYRYSVTALQEDFRFLKDRLEQLHPDLYLYTPRKLLDSLFETCYDYIVMPMSEMQFYRLIVLLNPLIGDGHTQILPSERIRNYFNQQGRFFPFFVVVNDTKLFVNMNCSADRSIPEGAQLISINGIHSSIIVSQLLYRLNRDGYNLTYPQWILDNYFKEYYGFLYGHPDSFSIVYQLRNGPKQESIVEALSKDSIKIYRQAKYAGRDTRKGEKKGIVLEINKKKDFATLGIKSFDREMLQRLYGQNFDSTIQEMLTRIQDAHVSKLILDIRNNQGGDFEPAKRLLSYLILQPLRFLSGCKDSAVILPDRNGFKGKLLVLINGGSFSATSILSSYLEASGRGVFVGEETGGNKDIISGDPIDTVLPNTKILLEVSTEKFVIRSENSQGHGILPKIQVTTSIEDIIANRDPVMDFAERLISELK